MFEIGTSLREARSRRRIEFAQAEQATKIRGKYLRALEDEQFDVLPSQTYVKGFLRNYADYLGLDGQLYVDEYNSRFVAGVARERLSRRTTEPRERRLQTGIVVAALAVIALLTAVVVGAWKLSGSGHAVPPPARHVVVHKPAPAAPVAYLEITALRGPSKVIVNRTGSGSRIIFEGTLARGETQAFNGKHFWLNVGAPENLVIKVAGRRVHLGGYRPWVVTVTPTGWRSHAA